MNQGIQADEVPVEEAFRLVGEGRSILCPVCRSQIIAIPATIAPGTIPLGLQCPTSQDHFLVLREAASRVQQIRDRIRAFPDKGARSIAPLSRIVSPPPAPVENAGSWPQVESDLGTALPDDFKAFIQRYGSGTISGFLSVLNPFSTWPRLNLAQRGREQLDALRELASEFGEQCPYALFPAKGGLLPVAMTDNGDVIHWLTHGQPEQWTIVVNESRGPDYEEFRMNLTTFLAAIVSERVRCRAFPRSFPGSDRSFTVILSRE
jgi:hypothetical protein